MVKLPSFENLKKMGSDLIDQAKAVKFGEMVDKVKSGIESGLDSMSKRRTGESLQDVDTKAIFTDIYTYLNEITENQAQQVKTLKNLENRLEQLAKIIAELDVHSTESDEKDSNIYPSPKVDTSESRTQAKPEPKKAKSSSGPNNHTDQTKSSSFTHKDTAETKESTTIHKEGKDSDV